MPDAPTALERLYIVTIILVAVDEARKIAMPGAFCYCVYGTSVKDAMDKGVAMFDTLYLGQDGKYRYRGLLFRHEYTHAGLPTETSAQLLQQTFLNVPALGNTQVSQGGKIVPLSVWRQKRPKKFPKGGGKKP